MQTFRHSFQVRLLARPSQTSRLQGPARSQCQLILALGVLIQRLRTCHYDESSECANVSTNEVACCRTEVTKNKSGRGTEESSDVLQSYVQRFTALELNTLFRQQRAPKGTLVKRDDGFDASGFDNVCNVRPGLLDEK